MCLIISYMKNKNIKEISKVYKGSYLDGVQDRIQYYINLSMKNLNFSKNHSYKIADCGSGYSLFIPFLTDVIKHQNLYMIDDFKSLDKLHTSDNSKKDQKYKKKFLPSVNKLFKRLNIKKINLNFEKQKLTFKSNYLDLVTSFHCIEHFHNSPKAFIKECFRVLKPGGTLIIAVPNAVNFRKRISVLFGLTNYYDLSDYWNQVPYYGHVREPTKDELIFFCNDSGFTDAKIYGKNFMGIERLVRVTNKFIRNEKISRSLINFLIKPFELVPGLCTDLHIICKKP